MIDVLTKSVIDEMNKYFRRSLRHRLEDGTIDVSAGISSDKLANLVREQNLDISQLSIKIPSKAEISLSSHITSCEELIERLKNENRILRENIGDTSVLKKAAKAGKISYMYYELEDRIIRRSPEFSASNSLHISTLCQFFAISKSTFNSWRDGILEIPDDFFVTVNAIPKNFFRDDDTVIKVISMDHRAILEHKQREKAKENFPYHRDRKVEEKICKMFLAKIPYKVIIGYVYDQMGLDINASQLSQRFNNSPPPMSFSVKKAGRTSWEEMWAISFRLYGKPWQGGLKDAFFNRAKMINFRNEINDIFTAEEIQKMRDQYFSTEETPLADTLLSNHEMLLIALQDADVIGMTGAEADAGGFDRRRFPELIERGLVFKAKEEREGRTVYIHIDYKDEYDRNHVIKLG